MVTKWTCFEQWRQAGNVAPRQRFASKQLPLVHQHRGHGEERAHEREPSSPRLDAERPAPGSTDKHEHRHGGAILRRPDRGSEYERGVIGKSAPRPPNHETNAHEKHTEPTGYHRKPQEKGPPVLAGSAPGAH